MNINIIKFLFLGLLLIPLSAFGLDKSDITMVSYTQSWNDKWGVLVVKNNTSTNIEHIEFAINYSDLLGNVIKSEKFEMSISIAPNGTTIIRLPSFKTSRDGNKFKTTDEYGRCLFKVGFDLIEYNEYDVKTISKQDGDCIVIILFFIMIVCSVIVYSMSKYLKS